MTDTQNEVFKTPVNKIRLFEHGAPGSQNLKLTRKYYTEDMPDGRAYSAEHYRSGYCSLYT